MLDGEDDEKDEDERATAVARPTMEPPITTTSWSAAADDSCAGGLDCEFVVAKDDTSATRY